MRWKGHYMAIALCFALFINIIQFCCVVRVLMDKLFRLHACQAFKAYGCPWRILFLWEDLVMAWLICYTLTRSCWTMVDWVLAFIFSCRSPSATEIVGKMPRQNAMSHTSSAGKMSSGVLTTGSIDHFQSTDDEPWKIDFKVAVYSAQAYIR